MAVRAEGLASLCLVRQQCLVGTVANRRRTPLGKVTKRNNCRPHCQNV